MLEFTTNSYLRTRLNSYIIKLNGVNYFNSIFVNFFIEKNKGVNKMPRDGITLYDITDNMSDLSIIIDTGSND